LIFGVFFLNMKLPTYKIKKRQLSNPIKISKYATFKDLIKSATAERLGIDNSPTDEHLLNSQILTSEIYDKIVEKFKVKVYISSFYRSRSLNEKIGGSKTSQHSLGMAMDLDADMNPELTNKDLFYFIKDNLEFDQLIWEFGTTEDPSWVHVSYNKNKNRNQLLRVANINNEIKYTTW